MFVMCKKKDAPSLILIPDFEALTGKYQVLKNKDVTKHHIGWESKKAQLIWRGSTAQKDLYDSCELMTSENFHLYSRVKLCELSRDYPHLLNAKFTCFVQGAESIPCLSEFRGEYISFEEQFHYKYHLFIDGNAAPYSASGWKFFTNSLIFKPESVWVQWYFNALKPFVHYVPVKKDLSDLADKIIWAQVSDEKAKKIAGNARAFARKNITVTENLAYFYFLLEKYSQLNFIK